ncbi:hypothetical protein [Botrimarina sp.]|uniref:hypothetical protein n=1 Tax=Botrimarina sp. TaxID=2795802 RepID=UPI0032ECA9CC
MTLAAPSPAAATTTRSCGAFALADAYQSLGRLEPPAAVWRRLRRWLTDDGATPTHRLAADAIRCGMAAACLRSAQLTPHVVDAVLRTGWRAVLNLRDPVDPAAGHFVLARRVAYGAVLIDDPLRQQTYRIAGERLAELWSPAGACQEVTGGVLVAIGRRRAIDPRDCADCPECGGEFLLPAVLGLGWRRAWAPAWAAAHCPWCDALATPLPTDLLRA